MLFSDKGVAEARAARAAMKTKLLKRILMLESARNTTLRNQKIWSSSGEEGDLAVGFYVGLGKRFATGEAHETELVSMSLACFICLIATDCSCGDQHADPVCKGSVNANLHIARCSDVSGLISLAI